MGVLDASPSPKKERYAAPNDSVIKLIQPGTFDDLLDLKRHGLAAAREPAVADEALGFWKALGKVWPKTREQPRRMAAIRRGWVHKTANVLNRLSKSQQPKAKRALQEIWMAETKADAETAFDGFIESHEVKYDKAAEGLRKDHDTLLAFYDFPAEHWTHLRTTNPIESTFATARHRIIRAKGCGRITSRSPWCSSSSTERKKADTASTATTS